MSNTMRGIQKETNRRPRNRNQYLYVRSIGPGCWGTCPTATQGSDWLSRKIPGAGLWTSSARTVWRHRPRWNVYQSEPFYGTKNGVIVGREVWTVWRVTALDDWRMLLLAFSHVICTRDPLAAGNELPCCCRNHSLLHTQRYCHWFAHSRPRLVSFLTPQARFFFNAPYT